MVWNSDSWGSFCYSPACSFGACLGVVGWGYSVLRISLILTQLVRGDVPLLFVVAKIGAWCCFLRRMVVRYGAAVVRMMVRTISKVEILRRTLTTIRSDKNCFINWFLLNL